eukprot:14878045-Heterocapsa_arctica.AAC.1
MTLPSPMIQAPPLPLARLHMALPSDRLADDLHHEVAIELTADRCLPACVAMLVRLVAALAQRE